MDGDQWWRVHPAGSAATLSWGLVQSVQLERAGLVERRPDPCDRRAHIPQITGKGEAVRSDVADASQEVERAALQTFSADEVALLTRRLLEVIAQSNDPGSCL